MEIDLHTHTIFSGHAYSTIKENIDHAKKIGLKGLAITDHGCFMPGANKDSFCIVNMNFSISNYVEGVRVIRGVEANILNINGDIDLPSKHLKSIEYILGALHNNCFIPKSKNKNTQAVVNAIISGNIDALAHLDDPIFSLDYKIICEIAAKNNVALEINNTSLKGTIRKNCISNTKEMLYWAKKNNLYIAVGSDAHFYNNVGEMDLAINLLNSIKYPIKKIISYSIKQTENFLKERKVIKNDKKK